MMELPTYRLPNVRHVAISLWDKVKAFFAESGYGHFCVVGAVMGVRDFSKST